MDYVLVHFTVICYILWTSGKVRGNLVYFFPFWYFVPRKIWQPCGKPHFGISFQSVVVDKAKYTKAREVALVLKAYQL
jgi:hypothetical protein